MSSIRVNPSFEQIKKIEACIEAVWAFQNKVLRTSMGSYESKKRTRPCVSCKRQKLKCQYEESLPCERCVKHGIACHFPSTQRHSSAGKQGFRGTSVPRRAPNVLQGNATEAARTTNSPQQQTSPVFGPISVPPSSLPTGFIPNNGNLLPHSAEHRADFLQNTLESMLAVFHHNQLQHEQQINLLQSQISRQKQATIAEQMRAGSSAVALPSVSEIIDTGCAQEQASDFRKLGIINKSEASELLDIFYTKMSAHMFGYKFEELSADELWDRSPLLLASICTVACSHHPLLQFKKRRLQESLRWLVSDLLNHSYSSGSDLSLEHTILGLVIAFLWLESNQLYISVAIQMARIWNLDRYQDKSENNKLWRLWYLLYIADGAQNLTSQKSPSIYKQTEPMIASARKIFVSHIEDPALQEVLERDNLKGMTPTNDQLLLLNEVERSKLPVNPHTIQNMHLCGLVEYHMAIESLFHCDNIQDTLTSASNILQPKHFGAPWETNMDLDKWMISWTITLQNIDVQNDAWCLKSTLLYYNFARMHINTRWLSERQASLEDPGWLKIWSDASSSADNAALIDASHDISYSAATSLLKLATKDKDVSSLFQFLPNHVYLMLFFACMIVLEAPSSHTLSDPSAIKKLQQGFKLVKTFRGMLASCISTDADFTRKIETAVQSLMTAFIDRCVQQTDRSTADHKIEEIIQNPGDSLDSESARKTISAWPSVNHGHP